MVSLVRACCGDVGAGLSNVAAIDRSQPLRWMYLSLSLSLSSLEAAGERTLSGELAGGALFPIRLRLSFAGANSNCFYRIDRLSVLCWFH